MSEDKKDLTPDVQMPTDLLPFQLEQVAKYVEAGLPGIERVDEGKMAQIMDLYLSGKNYSEIARVARINKTIVLYLSKKYNWLAMRLEYLNELEYNMRSRIVESKMVSQDFLLQLQHFYKSRIGNKVEQYLLSKDEAVAQSIDLKEVDKYLKIVETLQKLGSEPKQPGSPAPSPIGLNIGEGMTIKKVGAGLEITPKAKATAERLKEFANSRRQQESSSKDGEISDIVEEDKGEK